MALPTLPIPPIWGAFPPEVNTSRLMAGAGPAPMLQAATGWESLAISLESQADELASSLVTLAQMWQGSGSERAIEACTPMVVWLRTLSLQAHKRAVQAAAQAGAYSTALATTPPLPEIELNHVTNAALNATNFLGVNAVPIALNEADYVRMWDQAATVMVAYEAETLVNTTFEPIAGPKPIVVPGATETAMAAGMTAAATMMGSAAVRNAVFTRVSGQGKADEAALNSGRADQLATDAAGTRHSSGGQPDALAPSSGMQMAAQLGASLGHVPQQLMQGVTQPFQQLTQPLQQVSSMFGQMVCPGAAGDGVGQTTQVGMAGAKPFSNHPAIGGTGPATGAGMVRAASLPGAGGIASRTTLMADLVGKALHTTPSPVAVTSGAAPGATTSGPAPIGGSPVGLPGQLGTSGGNRSGLYAPAPLGHHLDEDEGDDW